jgi:hypothetical protein
VETQVTTLSEWKDFRILEVDHWIYRGQGRADLPLKTSLERFFDRISIVPDSRPEAEAELLREFQRTYFHYAQHPPAHSSGLVSCKRQHT